MAAIIDFGNDQKTDIGSMDQEALLSFLKDLQEQIAELNAAEPDDMDSEAYEEWGGRHEELEDLVDEVMDRLEELE